jgi:hypothetical protein
MNEKLNPVLAGMLGKVEEIREELINYGGNLESSTNLSEQTNSYEVANNALNSLECALKALAFDESERKN